MRILLSASFGLLLMVNILVAGTAVTSVDPPVAENIVTADATGTSFTRVFADPSDHPDGNANHGRGNTFRIGGDGTGGTYQIDGVTIHKDVTQSFTDAAFGLWIYEGTIEQYELGDGDGDGDPFNLTGITNVPVNNELFPLNGLTLAGGDFLTLALETPVVVDGDRDYGFLLRYFPASEDEPNFVQFHETGGIGNFGLGEVRATQTGQEIRGDRRMNYSILGTRLTTGPIHVDGENIGVHSITGELTDIAKGEATLTQGLTQYWYEANWRANPIAFLDAIEQGTDAPELATDPFASRDTWWVGGQDTNLLTEKELERYPQVGLNGTRYAGDGADDPQYSVRLTGEIFIPEDGEYLLRDGMDDFAMVAIDADGNGELDDLEDVFNEDVGAVRADSIGDVHILDDLVGTLNGGRSDRDEESHGLATIENVGPDGEWRKIEVWMAESGSLDAAILYMGCLLYTSPSPRDQRGSRMPSSA